MIEHPSRREFVRTVGTGVGAALFLPTLIAGCRTFGGGAAATDARGWERVPQILGRIAAPTFPARDVDPTRYGARGDGTRSDSQWQQCNQ